MSTWLPDANEEWPSWAVVGATFLGLNAILRAPPVLLGSVPVDPVTYLSDPLQLYYLFSLDLFGLFCLLALVPDTTQGWWLRAGVGASILFLLVYQTYDAVVLSSLHRSPILYADIPHLVGAAYLLINGGVPWLHTVGLAVTVGVLGLLGHSLPSLLHNTHRHLHDAGFRPSVLALSVGIGALVSFGVLTNRGTERRTYGSVCFSTTECLVHNIQASVQLNQRLADRQATRPDSTYLEYQTLDWTRPPSLYLVVIESYGSILTRPSRGAEFNRLMADVSDRLHTDGWHSVAAHSHAPVSGGLSWLSVATILTGTQVEHQPTFEILTSRLSRYPHLVHVLKQQGYETATLQPPVRTRPGLSVGNPYGFDDTLYLQDLDYGGPTYGWGIVPDQYSLAIAHKTFVASTRNPFFLFFETATSHAPWDRPPPPVVADPARFNSVHDRSQVESPRSMDMTERTDLEQLFEHIRYEWTVLSRYLCTQAPANSLVVVVGDHQPYLADRTSFATPLHILSRDAALVRRFEAYGLQPGLQPSPSGDTLSHAGLYSMLVRTLTAHDQAEIGSASPSLPPYLPSGIEQAALLPRQQ